jgi:pimeloyl-ACP methyl ester carboxylesterase
MKPWAIVGLAALVGASPAAAQKRGTMQHEYATVNGIKVHYVRNGHGPLILFLHGFPEFWYAWKDQLAEFGRDHLAVAPDLRGFNLSEKPAALEEYQAAKIIEDIRQLALQLNGGKRFVLVAHDWGGALAWLFAIRHPELLDKLVIINAPHPAIFSDLLNHDSAQQRASQYMLFFRSPQAEATLSADNYAPLLRFFDRLRQAGKFTEADGREYVSNWSQPGSLTGGLNYYRASRLGPPVQGNRDSLASGLPAGDYQVPVPTLVIWGMKDDALLPQNLIGLERYVPKLSLERIDEGTHWVIHEFPERVNRLIRGFLATR